MSVRKPKSEILRPLHAEDVPAAFQLSAAAGWNQTEEDWRTLLALAPETCLAVESDGELAATTTLLCYGQRLGWIGMVLTKLEFQRRGLAKRLFSEVLRRADSMGIETIKLDATEQGRPLYERFGFHGEQEVHRWSRPGVAAQELSTSKPAVSVWRGVDSEYFGADRSLLLEKLAQRNPPQVKDQSYLFIREGRTSAYLGPCISKNSATARALITDCMENTSCPWLWDLFPGNDSAVALARDLGFSPQRHLLRMRRGKHLPGDTSATYAIAGFELG